MLFDRQRKRRADKLLAATPGEAAEGVVGVGDRAVAVAARDDVALRFEKAIGALLGFLEFPMTIFRRVKPAFELTKLCLHLPDARQHDAQAAARRPEQSGDTFGEVVADRKPKATPKAIVVMAVARTTSEISRRVMMPGVRSATRGRMVPVPAWHGAAVGATPGSVISMR
ncbi:MAG TPA: hypothetical protein VE396_06040 [Xanthobacteraceae bacterium]|nr:hypothetical protein [Xanthobacteraceae bacterium]